MKTNPLSRSCPRCNAAPGDLCRADAKARSVKAGTAIKNVHTERRTRYKARTKPVVAGVGTSATPVNDGTVPAQTVKT